MDEIFNVRNEEEFTEEATKGKFKGKVLSVSLESKHPITGKPFPYGDLLYIPIEPLDRDWENQSILVDPHTTTKKSSFYHLNRACRRLGIKNFKELEGRSYVFQEISVKTGISQKEKQVIIPLKQIQEEKEEKVEAEEMEI